MTQQAPSTINVSQIARTLWIYRYRWLIPTVVITALALGYACLKQADYVANQALSVREEAIGSMYRPGRFDDIDSMKTAQETVLELAKSRSVLRAALQEVGPAKSKDATSAWPSQEDIESLKGSLKVTAPNGAEFGSTEVFYLKVKNKNIDRAVALTEAICRQLDARLKELRNRKADSLVKELGKTVELAQGDLNQATNRLAVLERKVGSDLAELRLLNENSTGQSNLRRTLGEVKNVLREVNTAHRTKGQLLEMLIAAQQDHDKLLAAPNQLLQSQAALRQLKDGLVAAQLKTADLLGRMSKEHPQVKAALTAEQEIRDRVHGELATAIDGIKAELKIDAARIEALQNQQNEIHTRMSKLAQLRAGYENLVADVRQRNERLKKARHDLAAAQASQASAQSVSLITLLDGPVADSRPQGPGKSSIALLGLLGGLTVGLGLVFLTVPATAPVAPVIEAKPQATPSDRVVSDLPTASGLSLKEALARLAPMKPVWN